MCKHTYVSRTSFGMNKLCLFGRRYREQAAKDAEHVWRHVQLILKERGWSGESVAENDVKLFCKHSAELRLIRGSSLAAELDAMQLPGDVDISN